MARLVLLNGAPGSGKSTLARRYADEHPLTLALDIDVVRGMLGGWLDHPAEAGRLARRMAVEMARAHLAGGREVVVAQFLGRLDFVLALEQLADEAEVAFVEVALLSSAEEAADRFLRRAAHPESSLHRDAAALLERSGGAGALPAMYLNLLEVVAGRPRTLTVVTVEGDVAGTYRALLARLDGGGDAGPAEAGPQEAGPQE